MTSLHGASLRNARAALAYKLAAARNLIIEAGNAALVLGLDPAEVQRELASTGRTVVATMERIVAGRAGIVPSSPAVGAEDGSASDPPSPAD